MKPNNVLYETALKQFDTVAVILNIEDGIRERMRYPKRSLIVSVPVKMDAGKPLLLGGSLGRTEGTGRGVAYMVMEAARVLYKDLRGLRVAIQGLGNVGAVAARLLYEQGCNIVAVSDVSGGAYNPKGILIPYLTHYLKEKMSWSVRSTVY